MDEITKELAELRQRQLKRKHTCLEDGVYTPEGILEFERQFYFEEKLSLMMPAAFTELPPEIAKIKYPSNNRPQVIRTNRSGSVNITFSYFEQPLNAEDAGDYAKGLRSAVYKVQPANVFFENAVQVNPTTTIGWFDFKGYALDDQIYNFMFAFPIDTGTVLGSLNCCFGEYGTWKPVAMQILNTIRDETKDTQGRIEKLTKAVSQL